MVSLALISPSADVTKAVESCQGHLIACDFRYHASFDPSPKWNYATLLREPVQHATSGFFYTNMLRRANNQTEFSVQQYTGGWPAAASCLLPHTPRASQRFARVMDVTESGLHDHCPLFFLPLPFPAPPPPTVFPVTPRASCAARYRNLQTKVGHAADGCGAAWPGLENVWDVAMWGVSRMCGWVQCEHVCCVREGERARD
jgi:hypothetical protein